MKNPDQNHLHLLAIFHYVVGGIVALMSCIPLIHVFMGLLMLSEKFFENTAQNQAPEPFIGWLFVIMGSAFIVLGWLIAICILIAGRKLQTCRSRIFCMVIAGIECMFTPFGTVLGVFTLLALSKEPVKELFIEQKGAQ